MKISHTLSTLTLVLGVTLVSLLAGTASANTLKVDKLRCEYLTDPIGIDVVKPRLSWVLQAANPADRALKQTAYQVLVASSLEQLQADKGDLWDSGKVSSDQSVHIEYAGKALASEQDCFWKVRSWDQAGQPSQWSANGRWVMGILKPAGDQRQPIINNTAQFGAADAYLKPAAWQASWIGFDGDPESEDAQTRTLKRLLVFDDCQWVWTSGARAGNQPAGSAYFRKVIDIPAGRKVTAATFLIAADDSFTLYVNGHTSGQGSSWKTPAGLDVAGRLQSGKNALGIKVTNGGNSPTPGRPDGQAGRALR